MQSDTSTGSGRPGGEAPCFAPTGYRCRPLTTTGIGWLNRVCLPPSTAAPEPHSDPIVDIGQILAAHRAGIKRIIMPRDNENDLLDVREEVRRDLEFVLVDSVDDVLAAALHDEAIDDGPRVEQLVTGS